MKYFYISSLNGLSGICKYSRDFYELILKDKGYIFMDSKENLTTVMSAVSSRDHVHIEIGLFQKEEITILFTMLNAGYGNVSVTLHDAPLVKYPFHEFENSFLNKVSKFYDKYIDRFRAVLPFLKKLKAIYVLSHKGADVIKRKYRLENVFFLPHIVDTGEVQKGEVKNSNFIYFGFIGRNKGIEYSLQLHQQLQIKRPEINFYVVGKALGKERAFYKSLKAKYYKNVHYLGYVPENELNDVFSNATFAIHMFRDYRFFWPLSGSILYSLKKGKIVLTNKVNTIPEIINDRKNGFYLSGNLRKDSKILNEFIENRTLLEAVNNGAYSHLMQNHSAAAVIKKFNN
jgi:glycosyltransferase involved in cell wall biosynthesis